MLLAGPTSGSFSNHLAIFTLSLLGQLLKPIQCLAGQAAITKTSVASVASVVKKKNTAAQLELRPPEVVFRCTKAQAVRDVRFAERNATMGRGRQGGAVRYRSRTARVNFYCLRLTVLPTKRTTTARPMNDSVIRSLREALSVSPDNIPLRKHLAQSLMSLGQAAEAESEWQQLLRRQPGDAELMLGLAECYFQSGKYSASIVIIEELVGRRETSAATYLLHARLLLQRGDVQFAVTEYRAAISEDPSVADADLARRLGIDARPAADVSDGRMRSAWDATSDTGEQPEAADRIERPKITFSDVGGMTAVKEDIRMKIIYPLQHADMFRAYGKSIGGGILMYGPPGCGKTHMARATAGEIKAGFMNIGIHDVLDMWIGNSEKQSSKQPDAVDPVCCFSTKWMPWARPALICGTVPDDT